MTAAARPVPRTLQALHGRTVDVLVLGGGINGTGAAREAARRGLSVALVEKEDFGYGTTGRSTRLIHGGLRYLAMYDFALVRESLVERERLLRNASHLVHPITFLIPFYRGQATSPWKLRMGLWLYDLLAGDTRVPRHRVYTRDEALALEPGLAPDGLRGAASYGDGQVPLPERLCVENLVDAAEHGAVAANHACVLRIEQDEDGLFDAVVADLLHGGQVTLRARRVVNTTGPWIDRLPGFEDVASRMTKGAHLVTPRDTRHAILLFSPDDDRVFFSIPWLDQQLVGTTDTDFHGDPGDVHADADDVAYLQRGIKQALPRAHVDDVHYTYAGIRNLVAEPGKSESDVSRRHQVLEHVPGLVSLVGGKITPYRATCEEVVDRVAKNLAARPSDTATAPLPGAPNDMDALVQALRGRAAKLRLAPGVADTLAHTYGTRAHAVLDRVALNPAEAEVVCPHAPMIAAEVAHAVEAEMARTAGDILLRRTRVGWAACEGRDALPVVLDRLDRLLGRSAQARKDDEASYMADLAHRHRHEARPA